MNTSCYETTVTTVHVCVFVKIQKRDLNDSATEKFSVGPLIFYFQLFFVFGGKSIAGIASNSPTLSLRLTAVSNTGHSHLAR